MADQSQKALNLASEVVDASDRLMQAVYDLRNLKDERDASQISFLDFEDELAASNLKHVEGSDLQAAVSRGDQLLSWMTAGNHDRIFNRIRP